VIKSPIAKKILDDTVLTKLLDKRRYILLKECLDKGTKFSLALVYSCLGRAKQSSAFGKLRQILVNVLRNRLGIRSRRKRFKGGSAIVDVYAILLDAFSSLKALSLLTGNETIPKFEYFLQIQTIVPASPYVVLADSTPRLGGDAVAKRIYTQAETMYFPWNQAEETAVRTSGSENEPNLVTGRLST
jgi:hypothetical protein